MEQLFFPIGMNFDGDLCPSLCQLMSFHCIGLTVFKSENSKMEVLYTKEAHAEKQIIYLLINYVFILKKWSKNHRKENKN